MDSFTITRGGRLIHHMRQWQMAPGPRSGSAVPLMKAVPDGDVDADFHGDIRFGNLDADDHYVEYVARFTNGNLEWIKPYDDLSELQKSWLANVE
jgi:hypothetical protein